MRLSKPFTRTRAAVCVLALAAVLGAAGTTAGLAASAGAAVPHRASRAKLISRADAICLRVNRQTAPYQARINRLVKARHPNYKRMAAALNRGVAIEQTGLDQLRALPVPPGDRVAVTKVWNELGAIISASQDMSTAVGNGDIPAVNQATQRKDGAEAVYHNLAHAFGFKYCGSSDAS